VRRQQQEDEAAGVAQPYSTMLAASAAWTALGAAYWVLRTIQYGLHVPWDRRPPPTRSVGYALNDDEMSWSKIEVGRWLLAGYVRRLSQAAGAGSPWVSPTFVVHGGKARLVIDLRAINRHIRKRVFQYQRLPSFLATLVPGDHLVSWDVKDAFYHVRILLAHRKFFRFFVAGVVYEPRVLPFGMKLSPWVWTKVMRPVVAALRLQGYRVNAYVDDFASTGRGPHPSTAAVATAGRRDILELFRRLGLQVHPTKGEAVGTTRLPLPKFLIDTTRQVVVLPAARLTKLVTAAKVLLSEATRRSRRVSSRSLQQFCGLAVSCYLAIPSARFYLRRLYDVTRPKMRVSRLSHGAARDLRWFTMLKKEPGVGRALWPSTLGTLTTDASPYGWGGH